MRQFMTDGQYEEGAEEHKLLKKHNLDGSGVIVGIGDSGADTANCTKINNRGNDLASKLRDYLP